MIAISGWTTITLVEDADHEDWPDIRARDRLREEIEERGLNAKITRYHGNPIAHIGGYRDWEADERILEAIEGWKKAVICHANDTSDTGHAKYYEPAKKSWHSYDEGEVVCIDEFEERELAHGRPVGAKACAYMAMQHSVYCHHSLYRPSEHADLVPNPNEAAWEPLRQAFVWFDSSIVGQDQVIEKLKEALEYLKNDDSGLNSAEEGENTE